jgi:hypothetical protein
MKQISFAQVEHQKQEEGYPPRAVPGPDECLGAMATTDRCTVAVLLFEFGRQAPAPPSAWSDSQAMRDFVGIDLAIESVPEATALHRFRHLFEKHAPRVRQLQPELHLKSAS